MRPTYFKSRQLVGGLARDLVWSWPWECPRDIETQVQVGDLYPFFESDRISYVPPEVTDILGVQTWEVNVSVNVDGFSKSFSETVSSGGGIYHQHSEYLTPTANDTGGIIHDVGTPFADLQEMMDAGGTKLVPENHTLGATEIRRGPLWARFGGDLDTTESGTDYLYIYDWNIELLGAGPVLRPADESDPEEQYGWTLYWGCSMNLSKQALPLSDPPVYDINDNNTALNFANELYDGDPLEDSPALLSGFTVDVAVDERFTT